MTEAETFGMSVMNVFACPDGESDRRNDGGMSMKSKKYAVVDKSRCVACGECTYSCRKQAICVLDGCHAQVDEELCVGCGLCGKNCPVGCITLIEREER